MPAPDISVHDLDMVPVISSPLTLSSPTTSPLLLYAREIAHQQELLNLSDAAATLDEQIGPGRCLRDAGPTRYGSASFSVRGSVLLGGASSSA